MNKYITAAFMSALLFLASSQTYAHHSSAPHFDSTKPVSFEGVITEFKFVNPHAWLYVDVTNPDGTVSNWNCEMGAASGLLRAGWTDQTFPIGATMKVEGIAARRDPVGCSFQRGTLQDGTTIARSGQITKGDQVLAANAAATAPEDLQVDLTRMAGTWITFRAPGGGGGGLPRSGETLDIYGDLLTEAGKVAVAGYDDRFDDPALKCSPSSIIRGYSEPGGASDVTITDKQIVIRHEFMDTVRTIDLTTRNHPANIVPSLTGHSVGWYEGDTLVVETVGFKAGVLLPHPGLMHSDAMKIVERFSLTDGGTHLVREYAVTDPKYFTKAYTGTNTWARSDIPVSPYNCVELGGVSNIRKE